MASSKKTTKGGVVDLQDIIEQISSVSTGLEAVIDAILSSTNTPLITLKAKIAKKSLQANVQLLGDLIHTIQDSINETFKDIDTKTLNEEFNRLVSSPKALADMIKNGTGSLDQLGKDAGILELVYGLSCSLNAINNMNIPNPVMTKLKMKMLGRAVNSVAKEIINICSGLNMLVESINSTKDNIKDVSSTIGYINTTLTDLLLVVKDISILALMTPGIAIATPIAILGVKILVLGVVAITRSLMLLADPGLLRQANVAMIGVRRLLRKIITCILWMGRTMVAMVLVVAVCAMLGPILVSLFIPFVLGLIAMTVVFATMQLTFWVLAKLSARAALMSTNTLINILIISAVMLVLALTFLVLAKVSAMVNTNILEIAVMMGLMMVVVAAIFGFMALCGTLAPATAVGLIAVGAVMLGVLAIMMLVGLLWTMTIIVDKLDADAIKAAVGKIIDCVAAVMRSLFDAKFTTPGSTQDAGMIGSLAKIIGGNLLSGLIVLIEKVAVLFVAIFALATMILLIGALSGIVKLYETNRSSIKNAPDVVNAILESCSQVINAVCNSEVNTKLSSSDGLFLPLMGFVFGGDMVSIFRLLFRVVAVALTMVTLAMIKFLCEELLWIGKFYKDNSENIKKVPNDISEIMAICSGVIHSVATAGMGISFADADGTFMKLVSFVSPDLSSILGLIFKVAIVALSMIVLSMIRLLITELKWIHDKYIELGGSQLGVNINMMIDDILGTINDVMLKLNQATVSPGGKPRSGLAKLLKWVGLNDVASVIDLMCSFSMIGLAMVGISVLMGVANMLKESWDAYKVLGGSKIKDNAYQMTKGIGDAINSVIQGLSEVKIQAPESSETPSWIKAASAIFGNWVKDIAAVLGVAGSLQNSIPLMTSLVGVTRVMNETTKDARKAIKNDLASVINDITKQIKNIVDAVNNTNIGDTDLLDKNLQHIEHTLIKISGTFNRLLGVSGNQKLFDSLLTKVDSYSKIVIDTEQLVNKINGLDISKMNALAKMFGNAAAFSQSINGNFDKLADVISEKIAPLIDGLKTAIENADKTIKSKAANDLKVAEINQKTIQAKAEAVAKQQTLTVQPVKPEPKPQQQTPQRTLQHTPVTGLAKDIANALEDTVLKVRVMN